MRLLVLLSFSLISFSSYCFANADDNNESKLYTENGVSCSIINDGDEDAVRTLVENFNNNDIKVNTTVFLAYACKRFNRNDCDIFRLDVSCNNNCSVAGRSRREFSTVRGIFVPYPYVIERNDCKVLFRYI